MRSESRVERWCPSSLYPKSSLANYARYT